MEAGASMGMPRARRMAANRSTTAGATRKADGRSAATGRKAVVARWGS
jgi:hypothetical protein